MPGELPQNEERMAIQGELQKILQKSKDAMSVWIVLIDAAQRSWDLNNEELQAAQALQAFVERNMAAINKAEQTFDRTNVVQLNLAEFDDMINKAEQIFDRTNVVQLKLAKFDDMLHQVVMQIESLPIFSLLFTSIQVILCLSK